MVGYREWRIVCRSFPLRTRHSAVEFCCCPESDVVHKECGCRQKSYPKAAATVIDFPLCFYYIYVLFPLHCIQLVMCKFLDIVLKFRLLWFRSNSECAVSLFFNVSSLEYATLEQEKIVMLFGVWFSLCRSVQKSPKNLDIDRGLAQNAK